MSRYSQLNQTELEAEEAALTAALEAVRGKVSPWLPIESAPRDYDWIIVTDGVAVDPACFVSPADDDGHTGWCGAGYSYGGILYDFHNVLNYEPTHWQPLPPPPLSEGEA